MGVRPDADPEELRRAYTRRALELHPDRLSGASPGDRAHAELGMKELNAAWDVLRRPGQRRSYDRSIGLGKAAPARPSPPPESPMAHGAAEVEHERPPETPSSAGLSRWVLFGPIIALGLLVAVILLLAAVTGSEGDGVDVETTERFPVGACVLVGANGGIVEAPCAEPRTGEIVAKVDFPRPCPAGTSAVVLAAEQLSLCLGG